MKLLLALILTVTVVWSGFWYIGSNGVKSGYETWFRDRQAEGWVAEYSSLGVQGYPNRFDASFTDVALADPGTGLAWDAPRFQVLALSYRPNHLIAVWPDRQRLSTPARTYDVQSEDMRASLILKADPRLTLSRTTLTTDNLIVSPQDTADDTAISALRLAAERKPEEDAASYRLGLDADGLSPAMSWREDVDPDGSLPETFNAFSADMTVNFDKAWDRTSLKDVRPQPRRIHVHEAEARWGRMELRVTGEVTVDSAGRPTGEVTVSATNWRDILQLAVNAGALAEEFADSVEDGLSAIAESEGNPQTVTIPLSFADGQVRLGPVPLGAAPVLRIR